MMKLIRLFGLMICLLAVINGNAQPLIIPKPVAMKQTGGSFVIDAGTHLVFDKGNKQLGGVASYFSDRIHELSGIRLVGNNGGKKSIRFEIKKGIAGGAEGYELTVSEREIFLTANSRAGIFNGVQTILQMLPGVRTNEALVVPGVDIKDHPRFKWRGMHLDVSRHFFSTDVIKEYLDLMARYKMNTFHWHLVDDQGWRIEIKKYPRLTSVGAWRVDHTDKVWGERPQAKEGEKPTYCGYYTQEQIKEIVAYAATRNITIVPEIEMPGHVASAIAAYPWLSCGKQHQLPLTGGNYTNICSNYCAGSDSVFEFVNNVLNEVIGLFPSEYIHVGGDEVGKDDWKKCGRCQARMKDHNLKTEEELQSYFMKRVEKYLISKKRKMIGWDEILEGGLAPDAAVMSWRGESGGIQAANMKHNVVMTPGDPCYFDHYQAGPEGEPLAIGGMSTLKMVYDYEPLPKELSADGAAYVMGAQANVWGEYISTREQLEYMVLPRMLALADVLWAEKGSKDWADFNRRMKPSLRYFQQMGYHYCAGNFNATIKPVAHNGKLKAEITSEQPDADIYYTIDGSEPSVSNLKYTGPIAVDSSMDIKAVTVIDGKVMGKQVSSQRFALHNATGRDVVYTNPVSRYYMADGPNTLTDGIRGGLGHGKYWHGFSGKDLIATIDLASARSIHKLTLGCLQNYKDWIFFPTSVRFETSDDGVHFVVAGEVKCTILPTDRAKQIKDFSVILSRKKARYVRVTATILEACPKGHPGEGKEAWLFADEFIVE